MQVVVIGAGKVGFEVALRLSSEGHDVVVIDKNPKALEEVSAHLDVMTVVGNGASPAVLERVGVGKCDLLIAVTEIDEVNMIACMTAKQYGVRTCVARIRNSEYLSHNPHGLSLRKLGIDLVIDPERLATMEIVRLLRTPMATEVDYFVDGRVAVVGLKVDPEAPIVGKPLRECDLPHLLIAALVRNGEVIIPQGDDVVQPSDHLFVIGRTGNFHSARAVLSKPRVHIRKVAILGAGKIGYHLASDLVADRRSEIEVTLIERDPDRAAQAAQALPRVLVIQGDGTKVDMLREEGIGEVDAFVAVTGEDHTNLLSTMLAKQLGVSEAIVEISREDYAPLAKQAGADAVIVPRLLTASMVLRLVRRSRIVSMMILEEGKAEAIELIASPDAPIVGRPLRRSNFPKGAIVGAVLRQGATDAEDEVEIACGDTVIHAGDRVLVFTLPEMVERVERLFGRREATKERP